MHYRNVTTTQKVTIKQAPDYRFDNELRVLQALNGNPCIRPLVDTVEDPPSLVLRHLDDNLLNASNQRRLEKADIKFVARNVLLALDALHERGYVHTGKFRDCFLVVTGPDRITDVKPNNILVNYGRDSARFSEVQLGDCGDTCMIDLNADPLQGHVIGAAIFRSPEAMLNLRWRAPTDIWSFGATVSQLLYSSTSSVVIMI